MVLVNVIEAMDRGAKISLIKSTKQLFLEEADGKTTRITTGQFYRLETERKLKISKSDARYAEFTLA